MLKCLLPAVPAQAPSPRPASTEIEAMLKRLLHGTLTQAPQQRPVTASRDWSSVLCFSCDQYGHGVSRCPKLDVKCPYMLPGWSAEKRGDHYTMISPHLTAKRLRAGNDWSGMEGQPPGSVINSDAPDPGGGVLVTTARTKTPAWTLPRAENQDHRRTPDEHMCFPLAQESAEQLLPWPACCQSTRENDNKLDGAVNLSALMIDLIQEPVDILVPTGFASAKICTRKRSLGDVGRWPLCGWRSRGWPEVLWHLYRWTDPYATEDCWVDRRPCWKCHCQCGVLGQPCWRLHRQCVVLLQTLPAGCGGAWLGWPSEGLVGETQNNGI